MNGQAGMAPEWGLVWTFKAVLLASCHWPGWGLRMPGMSVFMTATFGSQH